MQSLAVAEPKTESEPADATVLGEDMAAPPASLADIPLSRGRTAIEICDKPGEITLLLQLGHGRTPPVGTLDRTVFDPGASQNLIGDFDDAHNRRPERPGLVAFLKKIYRVFLQIPK